MEVPPRPKEQKIIPQRLMTWLVTVGLVMAAGTLGVMAWATTAFPSTNSVIAQTMGVTTFALFRLFSSLETADETESLFSGSIFGNRPLLIATGLSVLTIILATELGFLQNFLDTVGLTGEQWLVCIGVSASLIVVEEVKKALKVKTGEEPVAAAVPGAA